jgi:hypothetical protein
MPLNPCISKVEASGARTFLPHCGRKVTALLKSFPDASHSMIEGESRPGELYRALLHSIGEMLT